jgi:hypothetical protein
MTVVMEVVQNMAWASRRAGAAGRRRIAILIPRACQTGSQHFREDPHGSIGFFLVARGQDVG